MASNAPSEETNHSSDTADSTDDILDPLEDDEEEEEMSHRFSEPWEDSDVILVVEDERFHVHRLILSMNSPVFKAMFKSEFKEATNNEIPLPEKKANEVLDFLKQFYMQEREEITVENVEHLFKLSDEYQVKAISDSCVKFLECQVEEEEEERNVMKILKLASLYKLENILQSCYNTIREMDLQSILKAASQEPDLDKETVQNMLSGRIELLETFLARLHPEFTEMVDRSFRLWHKVKMNMKWCPEHFYEGSSRRSGLTLDERIRKCLVCKEMIRTMHDGLSSLIQEYSKLVKH